MMDNTNYSQAQEDNSCRIAITGLSYKSSELYSNDERTVKKALVQISKDALIDDLSNQLSINEKVNLVIADCTKDKLISAEQLLPALGLAGSGLTEKVSNPMQGLDLAIKQLKSASCDAVLFIACASIPSKSELASLYYFSVFILRPLSKSIANNRKIYASIPLLIKLEKDDSFAELESIYREANISSSSVNLFTLEQKNNKAIANSIKQLSKFFANNKNNTSKEESWCALRLTGLRAENESFKSIASLVETIVSIQQRKFLPIPNLSFVEQIDLNRSPFYFNLTDRPWFHPQIHPQFRRISPQPEYSSSLRRAALHIVEEEGQAYHMVAEECEDLEEVKRSDLQPEWPSEIFIFFAENYYKLAEDLGSIEAFIASYGYSLNLKDVAFTVNSHTAKIANEFLSSRNNLHGTSTSNYVRAAFVCLSIEDLFLKIQRLIKSCLEPKYIANTEISYFEEENVYWQNPVYTKKASDKNRLAFILPGLGAAYPNMLAELCLHFPEIRAIFDFVDYLSVSGGSKLRPSDRIFCRLDQRTKTFRETPASLAVMDSAVITVLMAEWAIFTLLLNLDIVPDILLGSSTGEFAALTMSGAVDIFKAAPLFYHLSTGMVHALPLDQLVNLRSLRVNDSYEKIESDLAEYTNKIYLSANLSPQQLILTGDRDSINALLKTLESRHISADFLPFAIPYHTSLVADVVSANNPDIAALQITTPMIESWSCSLAAPYPNKSEKIKKMTTDLFSKPILFRESIETLYKEGVRTFLEVGPRGSLAPIISETLQSRPHVSLAANRSDMSAITQFQNILSVLFVNDIYMDLSYLYVRRSANLLPIFQKKEPAALKSNDSFQGQDSLERLTQNLPEEIRQIEMDIAAITASFQKQLLDLEEQVMSYLLPNVASKASINGKSQYISSEIVLSQTLVCFDENTNLVCRKLSTKSLPEDHMSIASLLKEALTPAEFETWRSFAQPAKRREWLAGRIAVKESVRSLIHKVWHHDVSNQAIEIDVLSSGKPYLKKLHVIGVEKPVISITHKDGEILALAADKTYFSSVGIDLESSLLDSDIEDFILSESERKYLDNLEGHERATGIKKIWSSKEAVAKLLGLALPECFKKLTLVHLESETGKYTILADKKISDKLLTSEPNQYVAYVAQLEKYILAIAFTKQISAVLDKA